MKRCSGAPTPTAGKIKWGANLNIGYYDQRLDEFDPESTVLEEAAADRPGIREQELRDVLATMLFRGDDVHKPIGLLSGGERARVRLAQLLLDKPNVLVLDEPTNHLDIASREALEGALRQFPGTILCVSHDRYFLDQVAEPAAGPDAARSDRFCRTRYGAWAAEICGRRGRAARQKPAETERPPARAQPPSESLAQAKERQSLCPPVRAAHAGGTGAADYRHRNRHRANARAALATPPASKIHSAGRQLQEEYAQLSNKLEALEAEYFAREV